eukprot:4537576-Pyramimonas_sp.AAC.2
MGIYARAGGGVRGDGGGSGGEAIGGHQGGAGGSPTPPLHHLLRPRAQGGLPPLRRLGVDSHVLGLDSRASGV